MSVVKTPPEDSSLYLYLKKEKDEIDRYKWLESEKVGHDIGWDMAMFQWIERYESRWHSETYKDFIKKY